MARTALYRHFDADGRLLYVGISDCLFARDKQHAATAHWHGDVVRTETEWFADRNVALMAEWHAIRDQNPLHNVRRSEPFRPKPAPRERQEPKNPAMAAYFRGCGIKQSALAANIRISRSYMSLLLSGDRKPSLDLAVAIERATDGAVPPSSWVDPTRTGAA